MESYVQTVESKRTFFQEGHTRNVNFRIGALSALASVLQENEQGVYEALAADMGKSSLETYETELGMVLHEIRHMVRYGAKYARARRKSTSLLTWPSSGKLYTDPYGVALIISPWNYPLYLSLAPAVAAIAAGNCVVLKPSEMAPHTSALLAKIIDECFEPRFISVEQGGAEVAQALLEQRFDYIFYTGSTRVGKIVMEKAAAHLTPVTLELGGKSPCIVDDTADLAAAARRITWGKFLNGGQTCVAPDYLLVHSQVREPLLRLMKAEILRMYGENPLSNPDYPRIVNRDHLGRLTGMLTGGELYCGGCWDLDLLKLEPTILLNPSPDSGLMRDEIFGPILPVLEFEDIQEAIDEINTREHPLALYLFTNNPRDRKKVMQQVPFGGGCVNDTIMHLMSGLPFGGVGQSGMGRSMGRAGFDTFTHYKGVLRRRGRWDIKQKFPPYSEKNLNLIKKVLK